MATKDNVQGVVLALFGASAGGHLSGLTASATANGLTAVASDLAASAGFILGKDLSTAVAFRDNMLTNMGISSTNSAYAAAAAWADGELAKAGANRGEIVAVAVTYMAGLTDATSPFYAAAAAFNATVASAVAWSEGAGKTVLGVAELIAQQGGSGGAGSAFTLDSALDNQDFSAYTSVSVVVAGDDDATEGDKFSVTGSAGDDTFSLDTWLTLHINAGSGTDTLDLREIGKTGVGADEADVNLQTGVANADLQATLTNFENVIASDLGGRLVGTTGANQITLGDGNDDVAAAGGDDTIIVDDASYLSADDSLDGGSGTDTIKIDGENALNLDTGVGTFTNIENVVVTGTAGDDVVLTMGAMFDNTGTSAVTGGVRKITIEDAPDLEHTVAATAASAKDINLIGVSFVNVQILELDADTGTDDIRIDTATLVGITEIIGTANDDLVLRGGTYDFSGLEFNTMTTVDGSASANDTVVLGVDNGDLATVNGGASTADVIKFAGTDVGDLSAYTAIDGFETLEFGSASSVVLDNGNGTGAMFKSVIGSEFDSDTLTFTGGNTDLTTSTVSGVETIVIDNGGSAVSLTLGVSTLEAGTTVIGDSGTDTVTIGETGTDVGPVVFKDFEVLDVAAKMATITVATFATFAKVEGTDTGRLTFTDSGVVTLKSDADVTGDLRIQGATGDDTWTIAAFNDGGEAVSIRTGAGNDSLTISSGNVLATASILLEAGDDTFALSSNIASMTGATVDGGQGIDTITFGGNIATNDIDVAEFLGFEKIAIAGATASAVTITLVEGDDANFDFVDFSADTSALGSNTITLTLAASASGDGINVTGSAGVDTIYSSAEGDTIDGGAGADYIEVQGTDAAVTTGFVSYTLTGGAGTDEFYIQAATHNDTVGSDAITITDYTVGEDITFNDYENAGGAQNDVVEVSQSIAQAIVNGSTAPSTLTAALNRISNYLYSTDANDVMLTVFQFSGDTYVYVDGSGAVGDFNAAEDQYVKLVGLHNVALTDIAISNF
jgi:hypothetical protein